MTPNADYGEPEPDALEQWVRQFEWQQLLRWHPELAPNDRSEP